MDKLGVSTNFGWKLLKEENRIFLSNTELECKQIFRIFFAFRDIFRFFLSKNSRKKSNEKTYFIFIVITIKFEFSSFLVLMKNASKKCLNNWT